jgi:hypothetical protein
LLDTVFSSFFAGTPKGLGADVDMEGIPTDDPFSSGLVSSV